MTGWTSSEAVGRPLKQVFRTVDAETFNTAEMPIAEVLRDGDVVLGDGSTVIIARDGTTRPVESTAAPLKDNQGAIGGVVLVFRDITDRRRAEAQLAEQTRLAESLHRVGSRLAANRPATTCVSSSKRPSRSLGPPLVRSTTTMTRIRRVSTLRSAPPEVR